MKASPFQIGIIIFFVVFIVLGMLIFTGVIGGDKNQQQAGGGGVVMWGTYPEGTISKLINEYNTSHQKQGISITYVPIASGDLDTRLAEAIASGTGPDIVIIGQDQIIKNQSKLYTIPYASLPEATFRSTFAGGGELFMLSSGIVGLPLTVDPLIMYYNRDLLEGAGITIPPKTWNEVVAMTPKLTQKNGTTITQSAIPFGIYSNLNHAGDILSMLLFQAGNPIVTKQDTTFLPVLGFSNQNAASGSVSSGQAIVNFFTQFVDPTKDTYTWNRSFTNARNEFISGRLAIYIGYASELPTIVAQNPNLNFDISKVPQSTLTGAQVTFGRTQALAVVKASRNQATALQVASELTGAEFASKLVTELLLTTPVAPARRDLLAKVPENVFTPTLYSSAIIARGWYSPGDSVVDPIFNAMVDNVVRGASNSTQSVADAQSRLTVIFGR